MKKAQTKPVSNEVNAAKTNALPKKRNEKIVRLPSYSKDGKKIAINFFYYVSDGTYIKNEKIIFLQHEKRI